MAGKPISSPAENGCGKEADLFVALPPAAMPPRAARGRGGGTHEAETHCGEMELSMRFFQTHCGQMDSRWR